MKKRIMNVVLAIAMIVCMIPFTALAANAEPIEWSDAGTLGVSGIGSEDAPYLISTLAQLEALADAVNSGTDFADTYFKLTENIGSMSGDTVTEGLTKVIGNGSYSSTKTFAGHFDGDDHSVVLNISGGGELGMFGHNSGTIENLTTLGSVRGAGSYVAGICGKNFGGTIRSCTNNAGIYNESNDFAGVCAVNDGGVITGCVNSGTLSWDRFRSYMGGIASSNENGGLIVNCKNTAAVKCYSEGGGICAVNGTSDDSAVCTILNCENTGHIDSNGDYGAGICSTNYGNVLNCINKASMGGNYGNYGGICGINYTENSVIKNCVSIATKDGDGDIVGICYQNVSGATIDNCYWLRADGISSSAVNRDRGNTTNVARLYDEDMLAESGTTGAVIDLMNNYIKNHASETADWSKWVKLAGDYPYLHYHIFNGEIRDNGDGTHSQKCECGEYGNIQFHRYSNHFCTVCHSEEPKADYTAVNTALGKYQALNESDYKPSTWAVLLNAVGNVRTGLYLPDQNLVDVMALTINNALDALIGRADYSAVNTAINNFGALTEADYTAASWKNVQDVIDAVVDRSLYADEQDKVAAMAKAINDAIDALVGRADYSAVNAAISRFGALAEADYTAASWKNVEDVIDAVDRSLYADEQDQVDAMAKAINDAIDALVRRADYAGVDTAISRLDSLIEAEYTPSSWKAVQDAIAAVDRSLIAGDQSQVNAMAKAINDAIDALRLVADQQFYFEYYLVDGHKPVAKGAAGLYNQRSYYFDTDGTKVIAEEQLLGADRSVTFEQWYLRTMYQYKNGTAAGSKDVRCVTMLDENLDGYREAGFIVTVNGSSLKWSTTTTYTSFLAAGEEIRITDFSDANDSFVLCNSVFASELVEANAKVTVKAFVTLDDGTTLTGSSTSFYLGNLK